MFAVSVNHVPQIYRMAVKSKEWRDAMSEEIDAMYHNQTWSIVPLPPDKTSIGY